MFLCCLLQRMLRFGYFWKFYPPDIGTYFEVFQPKFHKNNTKNDFNPPEHHTFDFSRSTSRKTGFRFSRILGYFAKAKMGIKIKNWFLKFQLKKVHLLFKRCSFSFRKDFVSFWAEKKISCILLHSEPVKRVLFVWKRPGFGHLSKILAHENEGKPWNWPKYGSFRTKRPHLIGSECRKMHENFFSTRNETKTFLKEKEQRLNSKCTFFSWNFKKSIFNFWCSFLPFLGADLEKSKVWCSGSF